jgi:hypothetical protein
MDPVSVVEVIVAVYQSGDVESRHKRERAMLSAHDSSVNWSFWSLFQTVNCIGKRFLIGLHVSPNVTVAFVPARFLRVVNALLLGKLTEKSVSQHMWRDVDRFAVLPVGVGLVRDALKDLEKLMSGEWLACARYAYPGRTNASRR